LSYSAKSKQIALVKTLPPSTCGVVSDSWHESMRYYCVLLSILSSTSLFAVITTVYARYP